MDFPEVYSHDGETYLEICFDFFLGQGNVIRYREESSPIVAITAY